MQSRSKTPPANKQDTGSQKAAAAVGARRPSSKKSVNLPTQAAQDESEEREDEEEDGEEGMEGEGEEEEEEEEEEGEDDDEGDSGDSESGEDSASGEEEEEQDDDDGGGDDESDVLAATQTSSGKSKLAKMTSTQGSVRPKAVSRSGSKPKRSGKVISLN